MIRKLLILIFVSILLAGCITSQSAEKGTLQLTSSPAGAEIYLDNQYKGSTPSTLSDVEPGSHTLEFRLKGYKSWKSVVTVPSGTSNYFAALTAQPGSEQGTDITPAATAAAPAAVTVKVSRDRMIVGDSNMFFGTATDTSGVTLTLFGPGYYANGIVLNQVKPDAIGSWSYTWNPGTKVQSGTYTIVVNDAGKTVSDRTTFTAVGDGVVSVSPSSYAVVKGEPVVLSGMCSTGASNVRVVLLGPDRFASGVDLGNFPVTADQTWSLRYATDLSMPAGVYSVYVSDVPQTTTGSTQFTIGYAS
jgi:uncharacterized protein YceK